MANDMTDLVNDIFAKLDTDNSGNISTKELTEAFMSLDTNNDKVLKKDEFVTNFVAKFGTDDKKAAKLFSKIDKDGDESITMDEIQELHKVFDANQDGEVSKAEFIACWEKLLE